MSQPRHSVLSTQYSVLSTQYSVLSTKYSVLSTKLSSLITHHSSLVTGNALPALCLALFTLFATVQAAAEPPTTRPAIAGRRVGQALRLQRPPRQLRNHPDVLAAPHRRRLPGLPGWPVRPGRFPRRRPQLPPRPQRRLHRLRICR